MSAPRGERATRADRATGVTGEPAAGAGHHPRPRRAAHPGPTLTVTQVRSAIGAKPRTRGTLRALGLRRLGQSNTLPDRPEIRGMIARVPHLVEVEPGGAS